MYYGGVRLDNGVVDIVDKLVDNVDKSVNTLQ